MADGDVRAGSIGFDDLLAKVSAQSVQRRPALYDRAGIRHIGETAGVVWRRVDRLVDVATNLGLDVKGARDFYVADVIT